MGRLGRPYSLHSRSLGDVIVIMKNKIHDNRGCWALLIIAGDGLSLISAVNYAVAHDVEVHEKITSAAVASVIDLSSGSTNTVTDPGGLWSITVTNNGPQLFYRSAAVVPCQ